MLIALEDSGELHRENELEKRWSKVHLRNTRASCCSAAGADVVMKLRHCPAVNNNVDGAECKRGANWAEVKCLECSVEFGCDQSFASGSNELDVM